MKYTEQQQKYIDASGGNAHEHAVRVIGVMERAIEAQSRFLAAYRVNSSKAPPEWAFNALKEARELGIKV